MDRRQGFSLWWLFSDTHRVAAAQEQQQARLGVARRRAVRALRRRRLQQLPRQPEICSSSGQGGREHNKRFLSTVFAHGALAAVSDRCSADTCKKVRKHVTKNTRGRRRRWQEAGFARTSRHALPPSEVQVAQQHLRPRAAAPGLGGRGPGEQRRSEPADGGGGRGRCGVPRCEAEVRDGGGGVAGEAVGAVEEAVAEAERGGLAALRGRLLVVRTREKQGSSDAAGG